MIPYYGDFPEDATVYIPINTFDSNDPAASVTVTNLLNTDVHIHKNGGTTQRNNAAGITMTIDYDSITGNHLLIIDTSDDTVADFWVAGAEYQVRVEGITVDAGTLNAWVGAFSIERTGGALALLKSATYGLSAIKTETAAILVDTGTTLQAELDAIEAAVITNAAGVDIAADIIALKAETVEILTDTAVIGALGAGLTALATQASVNTIDGIVDDILVDTAVIGALGAGLTALATQASVDAVKAETALIVADTNELQSDDYPTSIAAVQTAADAILVDTGTDGVVVAATSKTGYKLASDGADLVACDVATVGAAPATLINKVQAIWNRLFTNKTVVEALETSKEKDNLTTMETWTLSDDDTTAARAV